MIIEVSRENILMDSINQFKYITETDFRKIKYKNQNGLDAGGILKDWCTTVGNEIIKSGTFKAVPSGHYLTIDDKNADPDILKFTGKLIAVAFNKALTTNIKLTSFIWKILLSEKITINDMEEYDKFMYQSLKWILTY